MPTDNTPNTSLTNLDTNLAMDTNLVKIATLEKDTNPDVNTVVMETNLETNLTTNLATNLATNLVTNLDVNMDTMINLDTSLDMVVKETKRDASLPKKSLEANAKDTDTSSKRWAARPASLSPQ